MSDYGDDYDDGYGDDWLYVEDEYMQADDLAEHAVASPPPTAYDEDRLDEWDRFDYFNDLEYDFEGYDDANFVPHNGETGQPRVGQKRKRGAPADRSKKRQRLANGDGKPDIDVAWLTNSPIVWRAQSDRDPKPRPLPDNIEPYAVLKDWRSKSAKVPEWVQRPSHTPHTPAKEVTPITSEPRAADEEESWQDEDELLEEEEEEKNEDGEDPGIDPTALMAALQSRLASAGGPLSGMDPQQLLQFALRMANNQDAGDDIAGEMADEMLNQGGEDDEDEETEANLLSWVAQQRNSNAGGTSAGGTTEVASATASPDVVRDNRRPPTPPSSQAKQQLNVTDETMCDTDPGANNAAAFEQNSTLEVKQTSHTLEITQTSRKRKADNSNDSGAASPKKRATKSHEASTATSQAKSNPAKATRSGRVRR